MAPAPDRVQREDAQGVGGGRGDIGARFWGWESTMVFYEIMIILDGYAEMRDMPAPQDRAAGRTVVERYIPHLLDQYDGPCGLSVTARHHNGHAMTKDAGRRRRGHTRYSQEHFARAESSRRCKPRQAAQGAPPGTFRSRIAPAAAQRRRRRGAPQCMTGPHVGRVAVRNGGGERHADAPPQPPGRP